LPDPAHVEPMEARRAAFESAYQALRKRIEAFLALPLETMSRAEEMPPRARIHEEPADMSAQCEVTAKAAAGAPMSLFERWLTLWVFLCIVAGIALGQFCRRPSRRWAAWSGAGQSAGRPADLGDDHPDAGEGRFRRAARGQGMCAASASRCSSTGWSSRSRWPSSAGCSSAMSSRPYLPAEQIDSYIAGLILLAAAPCTAMVFVWSRLSNGESAVHDVAGGGERHDHDLRLRPHRRPVLLGISAITVPWDTLVLSVVLYIVIPLALAQLWRKRC
jgi:ACR3 family arsenite transporter